MGRAGALHLVSVLHSVANLSQAGAFGIVGNMQGLRGDARFKRLVASVRGVCHDVDTPRSIMQLMWSLAKVGARGDDVSFILTHASNAVPQNLGHFTAGQLSTVLWSLANLDEGRRLPDPSGRLANAIVAQSIQRISRFTPTDLTLSLWALSKMELKGQVVKLFAQQSIVKIRTSMLEGISPQGLSNSFWACAKLPVEQEIAVRFCEDAVRRAIASEGFCRSMAPSELAMTLWAIARVHERRANRDQPMPNVDVLASTIAEQACSRIRAFAPNSVSNIAWALATLDLMHSPSTISFLREVVDLAALRFPNYPPQAISNVCWALKHSAVPGELVTTLAPAATLEARTRFAGFSWRDLSGIISLFATPECSGIQEVQAFATTLVTEASRCCEQIVSRALLNIAACAVTLGLDTQVVYPLASSIEKVLFQSQQILDDTDQRKWNSVHLYCECGHAGTPAGLIAADRHALALEHLPELQQQEICHISWDALCTKPVAVLLGRYGQRSCQHYFNLESARQLLESRFWRCPVCRTACRGAKRLPQVDESDTAAATWFQLADSNRRGTLQKNELEAALRAVLPLSLEESSRVVEEAFQGLQGGRMDFATFEQRVKPYIVGFWQKLSNPDGNVRPLGR
eukprot:TRINITY_DN4804_c0_g3_i2.p1 TRINITY_DN4804_c0_g3~~TRINITY_DN4804_c0_g3_i2.p1  ORF type:complete len:682 (+),score=105.22 TRINITY_DN4804_c0_g3_i2:159-2048(+)